MDPQGTAEACSEWRKEAPPTVVPAKTATLGRTLERAAGHSAEFAVIDTPPFAEAEARAAAKAVDLVLVPCRPNAFDLHSIRTTTDLTRLQQSPRSWFSTPAPLRPRGYMGTELVNEIGMKVAPIRISERATFRHSTGSGQAAQETEPQGKAAAEVDALWHWICHQVGILPRQRANTPAKVPA